MFQKKRANLLSAKIPMAPPSRCDQLKLCPSCTLIIPSPMFWNFITLSILSEQFHTTHVHIQQIISSQNAGQFRDRTGAVIGLLSTFFVSSSDFGAPCIGVRDGRKKSKYFNLVMAINYITIGIVMSPKIRVSLCLNILINFISFFKWPATTMQNFNN